MKIDFCVECRGTGKILEQRLSEYSNSYDYYPVACPRCKKTDSSEPKMITTTSIPKISTPSSRSYHIVYRNEKTI